MQPCRNNNAACPPDYWDDPDWIQNALAFDTLAEPASEYAGPASDNSCALHHESAIHVLMPQGNKPSALSGIVISPERDEEPEDRKHTLATSNTSTQHPIICPTIGSIPPGRQRAKILKCGFAGCTSTKLYDRHYELKRHIETVHLQSNSFPCNIVGCNRGPANPFTRKDKLSEHKRNVHHQA